MGINPSVPLQIRYQRMVEARSHKEITEIGNREIIKLKNDLISQNSELKKIDQQINKSVKFQISWGGSYRGQMEDYQRQGYGELISDDQTCYRLGQWENDKIEGYGCSIFAFDSHHEYYVGTFMQGQAHGKGKLTKKDGSYYDGDWVNGEPEGKGIIGIRDYSFYDGQVQKGKMHGNGYIKFQPTNITCSGIFVDDQMVRGQIQSPLGNYFGEIVDGKMHGRGKFIWNDGSYYSGDFKDNQRDGLGVSKYQITTEEEKSGTYKWSNDKQVQEVSV